MLPNDVVLVYHLQTHTLPRLPATNPLETSFCTLPHPTHAPLPPLQVPVPVNLIVTSTLILYIGCHRSLRLRDKTSLESSEVRTASACIYSGTEPAILDASRVFVP